MNRTARTHYLLRRSWLSALQCATSGGCLSLSQRVGEFEREGWTVKRRWKHSPDGKARWLEYRISGNLKPIGKNA